MQAGICNREPCAAIQGVSGGTAAMKRAIAKLLNQSLLSGQRPKKMQRIVTTPTTSNTIMLVEGMYFHAAAYMNVDGVSHFVFWILSEITSPPHSGRI